MTKLERQQKENILDYYYSLKDRVNEADLIELNEMIRKLEKELGVVND